MVKKLQSKKEVSIDSINFSKRNDFFQIGKIDNEYFNIPLETLKKHFIALGASGSGKTVISKTIIEEAAMRGIPSLIIDPQGDLASLALLEETTNQDIKKKFENVNVTIFTPASSKGIPICLNPLSLPNSKLEYEDLVSILNQISNAICELIGFDIEKDDGKSAQAVFFIILKYCYENHLELSHFDDLVNLIQNTPIEIKHEISDFMTSKSDIDKISKKLKFLTIGEKDLLFGYGVSLNIDFLLGKIKDSKKTQISIIYLNTLESQEDKEFFVCMLATKLYEWMLINPSKNLQALFYIDEISIYLPAGALKPVSKPILTLIYKQARKYGVGCLMSTQNPGDVDYKAFAQVGTWAIGRLTTEQDRDKIKNAITSISKQTSEENIVKLLPTLKPGNFILFCPDISTNVKKLIVRRLYTKHQTLTEKDIKDITTDEKRKFYEPYFVNKSDKKNNKVTDSITNDNKKAHSRNNKNKILKINIDEAKAKLLIQKHISSGILSSKKTISDLKLIYEPLIFITLKKSQKGLFNKKLRDYLLFLDANTHNFIDLKENKKFIGLKEMETLNEDCIDVIKELYTSSSDVTKNKLIKMLNFDEKRFNTAIDILKKKKLLTSQNYKSETIYSLLFDLNLPRQLNDLDQIRPIFEGEQNSQITNYVIDNSDIENISQTLNFWFKNCAIIDFYIVYCPVYEIEIIVGHNKKNALLNAYNGKFKIL